MKKPPLVQVTWLDACFYSRTFKHDELHLAPLATRHTSGYLVHQDEKETKLAQTLDKDDDGRWESDGVFTIPTGWITKVSKTATKRRKKDAAVGNRGREAGVHSAVARDDAGARPGRTDDVPPHDEHPRSAG
jgi:hypothetical protein